jgi:DNA-binding CsgD family transcriptional regulator
MPSISNITHHEMVGKVVGLLGSNSFWRELISLLRQWAAFDNALVTHLPLNGAPRWLEEIDIKPVTSASPFPRYLDGMYLLDPFFVACQDGIGDGLYRFADVEPDKFRESEYFQSYFRNSVGEDELQYLVKTKEGTISVSLGKFAQFEIEEYHALSLVMPWVLALMRQHGAQVFIDGKVHDDMANKVQNTMACFGQNVLSPRELEVARLILRGYSSKGIAEKMEISAETVKVHRRHLYDKLDISSQPELFSLFISNLVTNVAI